MGNVTKKRHDSELYPVKSCRIVIAKSGGGFLIHYSSAQFNLDVTSCSNFILLYPRGVVGSWCSIVAIVSFLVLAVALPLATAVS